MKVERTNQNSETLSSIWYLDINLLYTYTCRWHRTFTCNCDKCYALDFPMVEFPFLSGDISLSSSFEVYISQLINYCCAYALHGIANWLFYRARILSNTHLRQVYITCFFIATLTTLVLLTDMNFLSHRWFNIIYFSPDWQLTPLYAYRILHV